MGTLPETARGRPAKDGLHTTSPAATIPHADDIARLLDRWDEHGTWMHRLGAAWREGYRAAEQAHADDYSAGYADGLLRRKHLEHDAVEAARIELARWGPGGRAHFGDPRPGDFPGAGGRREPRLAGSGPDGIRPGQPAGAAGESRQKAGVERTQEAIWALQSMLAAGADQAVIEAARSYAATSKVLPLGSFDRLVRRHELEAPASSDDDRGPSVATQLAEIAQELYAFGISDLGQPFAIPREGPKVAAMLRGSKTSLRALLSREYFTRMGRVPTQQALADALLVIEGFAQEQEPSRLFMRCAEHDGALWLDLGDQTGRAVRITDRGWSVEDEAPVLFKRTALTAQLPEPTHGGNLEDLWTWLNVSEGDRPLIAAELVARLFSDVPHVVLAILGEHGTAKTTTTKILVSLLDPSPVTVRKPPRDMESWVTMAAGSWVVALDNLSDIPPWLSDSICRASTGDGDVRRRLYTDGDYAVFAFRRCVIFNGIDVGALATDLADRTLPITLQPIAEGDRRNEKAFWADWSDDHPKLLGAILSLASKVLRQSPRDQSGEDAADGRLCPSARRRGRRARH